MRLGIFGGTFDPIHYGHLLLAESCREQCELDHVLFIPAWQSPHKRNATPASCNDRVAMLKLAIGGHDAFRVSTMEVDREKICYTVETLERLQADQPRAELFFLLGADSLAQLATWRDPQRICQLANIAVVGRTHSPPPDFSQLAGVASAERLELFEQYLVTMPLIEISGTDLRERITSGRSIRFQTPRAVEAYIYAQQLYVG